MRHTPQGFVLLAIHAHVTQTRLDDAVGQIPTGADDQDGRRTGEAPIAELVDGARGSDDLRRRLREPLQERIEALEAEIARVRAKLDRKQQGLAAADALFSKSG